MLYDMLDEDGKTALLLLCFALLCFFFFRGSRYSDSGAKTGAILCFLYLYLYLSSSDSLLLVIASLIQGLIPPCVSVCVWLWQCLCGLADLASTVGHLGALADPRAVISKWGGYHRARVRSHSSSRKCNSRLSVWGSIWSVRWFSARLHGVGFTIEAMCVLIIKMYTRVQKSIAQYSTGAMTPPVMKWIHDDAARNVRTSFASRQLQRTWDLRVRKIRGGLHFDMAYFHCCSRSPMPCSCRSWCRNLQEWGNEFS